MTTPRYRCPRCYRPRKTKPTGWWCRTCKAVARCLKAGGCK